MTNLISVLSASLVLPSSTVFAHSGVLQAEGFLHGFSHPICGGDHVLAMVAVGLWVSQSRVQEIWETPLMFFAAMSLGGVLGMSGLTMPYVEAGILASVLVFGLFVTEATRLPPAWAALIVGLFAAMHGHSHGAELPAGMEAGSYAAGFGTATACLIFTGVWTGTLLQRRDLDTLTRALGGMVTLAGLVLAWS